MGNAYESKYTGKQIEDVIDFFYEPDNNELLTATLPTINAELQLVKNEVREINNFLAEDGAGQRFFPLAGGALTNSATIISGKSGSGYGSAKTQALIQMTSTEGTYRPVFSLASSKDDEGYITGSFSCGVTRDETLSFRYLLNTTSNELFYGTKDGVFGANEWNDYAEFRQSSELCAGRVVAECGNGVLKRTENRLQPGSEIVSDTYGFIVGKTEKCKTPIAVCGRVLAYPYEDISQYEAGDAVCSGPNGTVSKMTREEIIHYPERIIGTVSEIPTYETWGDKQIKVDGRIWIRIK